MREPAAHRMRDTPRRIKWLAVPAGYIVDILISLIIIGVGERFDPQIRNGVSFATGAGTITAILLVLSTGAGGWLAGRLARYEYVLHGSLVGGIGIIDMFISSLFGQSVPLANILLQCIAVAIGGLGGWLSRWVPAPQQ